MVLQKVGSLEVGAAGVSGAGGKRHVLDHGGVGSLRLHGAARIIRPPTPLGNAARRYLDVAAKAALVRIFFLLVGVVVVALELLRGGDVDLALVLRHQLMPALAASVGRSALLL